ncbi:MAG: cytochrome c3 family protein [Gemmatimonadota bacterium]
MRVRAAPAAALAALVLFAGAALAARAGAWAAADEFLHDEHAGLFPVCSGCHGGVETGDLATAMPEPELCARCHDGEELDPVDWAPPAAAPSLLVFDHVAHAEVDAEDALACADCHADPGAERMDVRAAEAAADCLGCHAHEADEHLEGAACADCHRTLADPGAPLARALGLPEPASHEGAGFLEEGHGSAADAAPTECATCHTRERCTSCHVSPDQGGVIAAVAAAPAAPLPPEPAAYPTPADHEGAYWLDEHGTTASVAECGACHTRQSCTTCHQDGGSGPVETLAHAAAVAAPGAPVERTEPASHLFQEFAVGHGADAAADPASCAGCHARVSCEDCHNAPADPGYHEPNFASRHAFDAYAARLECQNCHDAARFCRDCHAQAGLVAQGRPGLEFHDAEPLWLLRHGQAARQTLESCAGCHVQKDCVRCHSELGTFGVNPHRADFDAERAAARNGRVCLECHIRNPIGGAP